MSMMRAMDDWPSLSLGLSLSSVGASVTTNEREGDGEEELVFRAVLYICCNSISSDVVIVHGRYDVPQASTPGDTLTSSFESPQTRLQAVRIDFWSLPRIFLLVFIEGDILVM
jgi:hypothetical protein